jgi:uncharacterized protein (UPF0332 family)
MAPSLLYPEGGCQSLNGKIDFLFKRADDNLESIQLLIDNGYHDIAVSRSYYAMFYAAEAVLLTKKLKFSSHSGVVSQFGIHFIKTGVFKPELGRNFNRAFDDRSSADYGFKSEINKETAEKAFYRADNFVKQLKEYLKV